MKPYGELQEVWVRMNGIPPKWCHWRVFAQIASGFGLLVEVDWSMLFKTFYETVRVKVAVRDYTKIPRERLFENKKLHIVEFTVEMEQNEDKGSKNDGGNDDGNDGGDDGKGGMDEEADDLYDTDTEKENEPNHDNPPNSNSNLKTHS
jgi:hypothetical protein